MKRNLCSLSFAFFLAVPAVAQVRTVGNPQGGYSVFMPVVTRAQGASTTFYTALDVTNNHNAQSTEVLFTYRSADGAIDRSGTLTTVGSRGNFHTDDFIQLLADRGVITGAQAASTFGTLVLTFTNAAFTKGSEATATARIYNYLTGNSGPSVALAFRAQPLRLNGTHSLASIITDTRVSAAAVPKVVTNLGLANIGINDAGQATTGTTTITLSFFDPRVGIRIGEQPTFTLGPGQVVQINDVFSRYAIPGGTESLLVVADGPSGASAPQIDGYISVKDVSSNDGAYFSMQPVEPAPAGGNVNRLYLSPVLNFKLSPAPTPVSGALELCLSSMSWTTTLAGDMTGTSYTFNLAAKTANNASGDAGTMLAEIIHRRGTTDTVLASSTFTTSKTYGVKTATVAGPDPETRDGDVLVLRVRIQSGLPCIAEFAGNGQASFIDVPTTSVR